MQCIHVHEICYPTQSPSGCLFSDSGSAKKTGACCLRVRGCCTRKNCFDATRRSRNCETCKGGDVTVNSGSVGRSHLFARKPFLHALNDFALSDQLCVARHTCRCIFPCARLRPQVSQHARKPLNVSDDERRAGVLHSHDFTL